MDKLINTNPGHFSTRKISTALAVKVLRKNGIKVNAEKAELILDFLYLLAKTYKCKEGVVTRK